MWFWTTMILVLASAAALFTLSRRNRAPQLRVPASRERRPRLARVAQPAPTPSYRPMPVSLWLGGRRIATGDVLRRP